MSLLKYWLRGWVEFCNWLSESLGVWFKWTIIIGVLFVAVVWPGAVVLLAAPYYQYPVPDERMATFVELGYIFLVVVPILRGAEEYGFFE